MNRFYLFIVSLAVSALAALSIQPVDPDRAMSTSTHNSGSIGLTVSNYGFSTNLLYPSTRQHKLMYASAPWIGAKRYRRDPSGHLYYWLSPNPDQFNAGMVTQFDPGWNSSLKPVVDTLCTVGFDGDQDLYELLPAYNPLAWNSPQYSLFNSADVALKSILGSPAPRPFVIPDPQQTYCFSLPQGGTFVTPGFETVSAWFYDYSPLYAYANGDLGASHNMNTHYPLGLAIHRESYAWNLQNYDRAVIYKYTMINSSPIDTLFDLAIGEYVDADVHPAGQGVEGAADDASGYVRGAGLDYAYSRDFDHDGGLSPYILANKLIIPGFNGNRNAWFWKVGDGPDDRDPRGFNYIPNLTSNEKYWLLTGRNANYTKYVSLFPQSPDGQYEQPAANDTRFLHCLYGSQPEAAQPNPPGRVHLAPGQSFSWYSVHFVGSQISDLNLLAASLETFITQQNLQINPSAGLTCIPYLMPVQIVNEGGVELNWHSYTDPDHFEVMYKLLDAPSSDWVRTNKAGSERWHAISGLDSDGWYQFRIASIYFVGADEVYLESETQIIRPGAVAIDDPQIPVPQLALKTWPNPLRDRCDIGFELPKAASTKLRVYNMKGQLIRTLISANLASGAHQSLWNGLDESGHPCAAGVYLLKLESGNFQGAKKLLLNP